METTEKQTAIETRQHYVERFLDRCLEGYGKYLSYQVNVCDDSDEDATSFTVQITNTTNSKKACEVLRTDDDESMELEVYDDFQDTDERHFLLRLFVTRFITMKEG